MSDHYYSDKPEVESQERTWTFTLKGITLSFTSDRGVFSKKEVDFGSRLLVEAFRFPSNHGDVLDVGCGYGPIGLTIAKADEGRTVHMIDVNERALELSRKNALQNELDNVMIYKSSSFDQVSKKDFAAILTNPPIRAGKSVVHDIFERSYSHLQTNGELWVVIQKKQGAPSAIEKLEQFFQQVEIREKKKGYYILCAKKID
ncbi:class I SAM-dependent methyltransferase [Bacillus solitudinis]|uniref:class I SAM-dependent methyltransferase n=1 Tax=Bacillus solitudinis TaxID=2014074 RepID=UPI000C249384|nr:class I SAM-dependent methyltransferase [Bacillus solitudinis]